MAYSKKNADLLTTTSPRKLLMLHSKRPRENMADSSAITVKSRVTSREIALTKVEEKKGKRPGKGRKRARRKPILRMEGEMIAEKM
jgi:hypothetical protein